MGRASRASVSSWLREADQQLLPTTHQSLEVNMNIPCLFGADQKFLSVREDANGAREFSQPTTGGWKFLWLAEDQKLGFCLASNRTDITWLSARDFPSITTDGVSVSWNGHSVVIEHATEAVVWHS